MKGENRIAWIVLTVSLSSWVAWGQEASQLATQPSEVPAVSAQEQALTNEDVVQLVKLGLGDEVVIAKIGEAKGVAFKTEVADLEKLKADGVSGAVIAAMLKRNTAPGEAPVQRQVVEVQGVHLGPSDVVLCTKEGNLTLQSIQGSPSSTYAYVTVLLYMDYPGLRADHRIKDRRPSVLIMSDSKPTGRYFFVRAKVDKGDNVRSVKMGRMKMFAVNSIGSPDKDWTIDDEVREEKPGVWRLTPKQDLEPGEYGLWVGPQGEMYDFAVD
jgi:hypothetical protein